MTTSGAVAAGTIGAAILHGTGWEGGAVLAAFFISSNLASAPRARGPGSLDPKGDRRDLWQVCANGGPAALGAALAPPGSSLGLWLVTASLAAAAADTWATSVGTRSRVPPRLLWFGRVVLPGTSGGMTTVGSAGGAAGALLVAATGSIVARDPRLLPVATLIGFLGMVADSALGAAVQGRFHCPRCNQASEWRVHRCGTSTTRMGGLAWLNNDGVNFLATGLAAGSAWAAWWLCHP